MTTVEHGANVRCIPEVMENLDKVVRQNNVFAQSYKTLKEMWNWKKKKRVHTMKNKLLTL